MISMTVTTSNECLLNESLQAVSTNCYDKTLRTGAVNDDESIDIKTIFCLSFFFLLISQRGGQDTVCYAVQ